MFRLQPAFLSLLKEVECAWSRDQRLEELLGDAPRGWFPPQSAIKLQAAAKYRASAATEPATSSDSPAPSANTPQPAASRRATHSPGAVLLAFSHGTTTHGCVCY